ADRSRHPLALWRGAGAGAPGRPCRLARRRLARRLRRADRPRHRRLRTRPRSPGRRPKPRHPVGHQRRRDMTRFATLTRSLIAATALMAPLALPALADTFP